MPVSDQGIFQDRYQLIPRVLIFATRGNQILLLKGNPSKRLWANLYNGVGGHVEKGENILTAAHREFIEETGLELKSPYLSAIITIDTGENTGIGMYVFRGTTEEKSPTASIEGNLEWHSIHEIANLPLVEDLPILIPKILNITPEDQPHFVQYYYNHNDELEMQFSNV